jgi:hypothetical protein
LVPIQPTASHAGAYFLIPARQRSYGRAAKMQTSGSYLIVESMIRQNKVMFFELEHLVASLERRGLITAVEQKALLKLARRILPQLPTDAGEYLVRINKNSDQAL